MSVTAATLDDARMERLSNILSDINTPNEETKRVLDDVLEHRGLIGPFDDIEELMQAIDH